MVSAENYCDPHPNTERRHLPHQSPSSCTDKSSLVLHQPIITPSNDIVQVTAVSTSTDNLASLESASTECRRVPASTQPITRDDAAMFTEEVEPTTIFTVLDAVAGRRYALTVPTRCLPRLTVKKLKNLVSQAASREYNLIPTEKEAAAEGGRTPCLSPDSFDLVLAGTRLSEDLASATGLGIRHGTVLTVHRRLHPAFTKPQKRGSPPRATPSSAEWVSKPTTTIPDVSDTTPTSLASSLFHIHRPLSHRATQSSKTEGTHRSDLSSHAFRPIQLMNTHSPATSVTSPTLLGSPPEAPEIGAAFLVSAACPTRVEAVPSPRPAADCAIEETAGPVIGGAHFDPHVRKRQAVTPSSPDENLMPRAPTLTKPEEPSRVSPQAGVAGPEDDSPTSQTTRSGSLLSEAASLGINGREQSPQREVPQWAPLSAVTRCPSHSHSAVDTSTTATTEELNGVHRSDTYEAEAEERHQTVGSGFPLEDVLQQYAEFLQLGEILDRGVAFLDEDESLSGSPLLLPRSSSDTQDTLYPCSELPPRAPLTSSVEAVSTTPTPVPHGPTRPDTLELEPVIAELRGQVRVLTAQRVTDGSCIAALREDAARLRREHTQLQDDHHRAQNELGVCTSSLRQLSSLQSLSADEARQLLTEMTAQSQLATLEKAHAALQAQLRQAEQSHQDLLSWMDKTKGRLRVIVRLRPPLPSLAAAIPSPAVETSVVLKDVYLLRCERVGHTLTLEPAQSSSRSVQSRTFNCYRTFFESNGEALRMSAAAEARRLELLPAGYLRTHGGGAVPYPSLVPPYSSWSHPEAGAGDCKTESSCSQQNLFTEVRPLVHGLLNGTSSTVLAYGQPGSGKSYTLYGSHCGEPWPAAASEEHLSDAAGLAPRAVAYLFQLLTERAAADALLRRAHLLDVEDEGRWEVQLSMLELHCDRVHDLLAPLEEVQVLREFTVEAGPLISASKGMANKARSARGFVATQVKGRPDIVGYVYASPTCAVRTQSTGKAEVDGLTFHTATNCAAALRLIETGRNRAVGQLQQQEPSDTDRSHVILTLHLSRVGGNSPTHVTPHTSKVTFVDLAGSERTGSGVSSSHSRMKEGQYINRSLAALGDVLAAVYATTAPSTDKGTVRSNPRGNCKGGTGSSPRPPTTSAAAAAHIPYRANQLTVLLQDVLKPHITCLFVACVAVRDDLMLRHGLPPAQQQLCSEALYRAANAHGNGPVPAMNPTGEDRRLEDVGVWLTPAETLSTFNYIARLKCLKHYGECVKEFRENFGSLP